MKYFIISIFLLFIVTPSFSQYTLDRTKEAVLLGAGIGMTGSARLFLNDFPVLSDEQIKLIYSTPKKFNFKLDEWATKQSSKRAKKWSDAFLYSSVVPPLVLLFSQPKANDTRQIQTLMTLETTLLTLGLTNIAKRSARRPRPYMYNDDLVSFPLATRRTQNSRQSFFSGHTSATAAFYFFTAKTYSQYYPDSKWKPFVWSTSIAIPALTGFLRVKAGKHFPTDVVVGYAVGALIGLLIPEIH